MFKSIAPAIINPGTRSLAEFHTYWAQSHGPLFSNTKNIWGYVQHLTLPEAYDGTPKPTHDGASMFWHEDLDAFGSVPASAEARALREAVIADDRQLSTGCRGGRCSTSAPRSSPASGWWSMVRKRRRW